MAEAGIQYTHHDVIRELRSLYEMLARVMPILGHKTPITVPQIWLNGQYVGGADHLGAQIYSGTCSLGSLVRLFSCALA
ncbi:hypothetical protein C1752_04336 [Acaryochloris thomasi RCC1774]|uniref:Uncharacterized protein n=2 Tax=Acaryochloris TaxID=155977 RepID=A0A2W1JTN1_9CYAN|nr:hypothetical protein C1752_04336 [Acaryochloris thomasi RCC1774]